jgi:SAM-dependent methyltransferase
VGRAGFVLNRCPTCGTAVIAATPATAATSSADVPAARRRRARPLVALLRWLVVLDRMRFVRGLPAGASIVDVGCGDGRFLAVLAQKGFRVVGIEPDADRAAAAADRGLIVAAKRIEDAVLPPGSLDAVFLWHSLEHLEQPTRALVRAHEWLRPGGRLVVAVPNLDSVQARIGGDRWFHQDVPRHRSHFTPSGLLALLERTGFESGRPHHVLLEHNVFGMWQTLLNFVTSERNVVYRYVRRNLRHARHGSAFGDALLVTVTGLPLLIAALAAEVAAGAARRGGTIVVVASRR